MRKEDQEGQLLCAARGLAWIIDAVPHDADDLHATEAWQAAICVIRIDVRWKVGSCNDCSNASFELNWVHPLEHLLLAGLGKAPALQ